MKSTKLKKFGILWLVILLLAIMSYRSTLGNNATGQQIMTDGSIVKIEGQGLEIKWDQTYGILNFGWVNGLIQTTDGGFAMTGYTTSNGEDMWLVKTDSAGMIEWNQTYGRQENDMSIDLIQTTDGGYLLAGYTTLSDTGKTDMFLLKTGAEGTMEWNQTYGGIDHDQIYELIATTDGGFAFAGYTMASGTGYTAMLLIKIGSDGIMEWNQTYGGTYHDLVHGLVQTSDGGFALGGRSNSGGYLGLRLVKTSVDGTMEWNQTFTGTKDDWINELIATTDGGFAMTGYTNFDGTGGGDMWLMKTGATGIEEWNQTYVEPGFDGGEDLIQTTDGGFALLGVKDSWGSGNMWLMKTDADGVMEWNQIYGGPGSDHGSELVQTVDGGFALAGVKYSTGYIDRMQYDQSNVWVVEETNIWLVKIGSSNDTISETLTSHTNSETLSSHTNSETLTRNTNSESSTSDINSDTEATLDNDIIPGLITMIFAIYSYRMMMKRYKSK